MVLSKKNYASTTQTMDISEDVSLVFEKFTDNSTDSLRDKIKLQLRRSEILYLKWVSLCQKVIGVHNKKRTRTNSVTVMLVTSLCW